MIIMVYFLLNFRKILVRIGLELFLLFSGGRFDVDCISGRGIVNRLGGV